ncbi:peptidylprolyl isomerase [Sphingomonas spermidinifaciens]|uniref:peptidylprolyl isomerase n=2 Tax=Sphingomonas spermidinifaciens TaxID=1141889 RepID=A0A2A4BAT1_9SPHN|nr:peptidylprolyl isomerase [Sphingomonas spermidinifaciens]
MLGLAQAAPAPAPAEKPEPPTPASIVAGAPGSDWRSIPAGDLLVMDLAGSRRVVIQLAPAPFAAGWTANIRRLAASHWWDGTAVVRVQDNYVVQWGDPTEKKPLPPGIEPVAESAYVTPLDMIADARPSIGAQDLPEASARAKRLSDIAIRGTVTQAAPEGWHERDSYAEWVEVLDSWPLAADRTNAWMPHCYGMVGVGRNLSPDTGTGAELYTVIGQAPRHLDRNIAIVGRVIAGMEHLSSLRRGTGDLGFYKTPAERTPIVRVRLASDLPASQRPAFEYLATDSDSFAAYVAARANRRDAFFNLPAGGVDICNLPVPVRAVK